MELGGIKKVLSNKKSVQ